MSIKGKRLPDGISLQNACEYSWMPYEPRENWPSCFLGEGEWHVKDPNNGIGAVGRHWIEIKKDGSQIEHFPAHTWVEHEDGSISFSPSLVMPNGWHGYLINGVFT
jgi:hypothetical protein